MGRYCWQLLDLRMRDFTNQLVDYVLPLWSPEVLDEPKNKPRRCENRRKNEYDPPRTARDQEIAEPICSGEGGNERHENPERSPYVGFSG